jgi:hypothetical protein
MKKATLVRSLDFDETTPDGASLYRKWVARDKNGKYLDADRFRNDLRERLEYRGYEVTIIGD